MAVIVAHPAAGAFFLRREMLYTAVTRAKLATVIVGTREVVARAARTPDTGRRHSRLAERLASPRRSRRRNLDPLGNVRRKPRPPRASGTRSSCSPASRARTTGWAPCSASARIRGGAPRSGRRRSIRSPVSACSTSPPAPGWSRSRWRARGCGGDRPRPERGHARGRPPPTSANDPKLAGRLTFVQGEAERLPFADGEFDALTFTYLLRYVDDRAATMRELARVVKPGGRIGMVEFGVPSPRPLRAAWRRAHPGRAPDPRPAGVAGVVRGRPLPRPEHRGVPRAGARPRATCGDDPGSSKSRQRRHELRSGLVMWGVRNGRGERARVSSTARRSTRCARAAGATWSRCSIRRTRPGTSATWRSARRPRRTSTRTGSPPRSRAFFLAVGISAHALDELHGRPLADQAEPLAR